MPPVILTLGITAGVLLSLLSLLIFIAAYTEKLSILLLCQILSIVMLIFLFLYSGMVRYSNNIYHDVIKNNCSYILKIVNEKILKCGKYVEGSCSREFRATIWEEGLDITGESCLRSSCCEEIQEKITLGLEILMIWSLTSCILLICSWYAGQGLTKKVEKFGRSTVKTFDIKLISLVLIITLLSFAGWFTYVNETQILTKNSAITTIKNLEILDEKYIPSSLCETLDLQLIEYEDIADINVTSDYGTIIPNILNGKYKKIQGLLNKSLFCPYYPLETYEIDIEVESKNK